MSVTSFLAGSRKKEENDKDGGSTLRILARNLYKIAETKGNFLRMGAFVVEEKEEKLIQNLNDDAVSCYYVTWRWRE